MTEKAEVVETVGGELVLYDTNLFPELKWQDPQEATLRFAKRFGRAQTADDLFNVLSGNSTQQMVGRKVEIRSVEWIAYQADDGVIPNAICDAVDLETGELTEFATTSMMCTMFIRQAELLELLPLRVKVVEKLTRAGQKALNFEKV